MPSVTLKGPAIKDGAWEDKESGPFFRNHPDWLEKYDRNPRPMVVSAAKQWEKRHKNGILWKLRMLWHNFIWRLMPRSCRLLGSPIWDARRKY